MFFIRNRRYSLIFLSGFTRGEYHVIRVDFIVALRRTRGQRRWTLRESLSSILWTLTPHPGEIRCGGALLLPRADRDIGFQYPVQVAYPHFDVVFGCFVFGLKLFAFQKITPGICLSFFIGGGMDCSFLRLRDVLP